MEDVEVICNMRGLLLTPSQVNVSRSIYQQSGGERRGICPGCSEPTPLGHVFAGAKATAKHSHLERPVQWQIQDDPPCFYPQPVFAGENGYCVQSQSEGDNLCKEKGSFQSIIDQKSIVSQWAIHNEYCVEKSICKVLLHHVLMFICIYIYNIPSSFHYTSCSDLSSGHLPSAWKFPV